MEKSRIHTLIWFLAYGVVWSLSFLLLNQSGNIPYPTPIVAWLYATIIIGILFGIHRISSAFSAQASTPFYVGLWSVIYVVGIFYALLLVLVLHFVVITPGVEILQEMISRVIAVIATVLKALSSGKRPQTLTLNWVMDTLAPIIALLALVILFALFIALMLSYIEVLRKNRELQESRLRVLQSQMEPHFLFNALNTIAAEIPLHPQKAETLTIHLAEFFRTMFHTMGQEMVPLEQELQLVQRYLEIQKARFGERLQFSITIDEGCKSARVPALMLQPLVENALKHGWCNRQQPFSIQVTCHKTNGEIDIRVVDNGCGFKKKSEEVLGMNHSLGNISQRLALRYGRLAQLTIDSQPGNGSSVHIRIPFTEGKEA